MTGALCFLRDARGLGLGCAVLCRAIVTSYTVASAQPLPVPLPPLVLVDLVWARGNIGRPCPTFAQHPPLRAALQVKRPCVQQCFREGHVHLFAGLDVACAQPVPKPLPPVVLVGSFWVRGDIGRPRTALTPSLPAFLAFQLEGAYVQQRLLERQELLVFEHTNVVALERQALVVGVCGVARAQPVSHILPAVVPAARLKLFIVLFKMLVFLAPLHQF